MTDATIPTPLTVAQPQPEGGTSRWQRTLTCRRALAAGAGLAALALLAGCSQPATGSVATTGAEIQRGLIGYHDEAYVYPVQVPGTNRIVEMRTSQPLDTPPTYEDYLKWKNR